MTADPMTSAPAGEELLWPRYAEPADLAAIEAVRLAPRGLPESTYALLARAATRWPDQTAITVLPDAARCPEPMRRTFGELLADVHRTANSWASWSTAGSTPETSPLSTTTASSGWPGEPRT